MDQKKYKNFIVGFELSLAFIGGFIDVYSLAVRGAFAMMQTGNIIKGTMSLFTGDYSSSIYSFVMVLSFVFFLFVTLLLRYYFQKKEKDYNFITLIINTVILLTIFFIPTKFSSNGNVFSADVMYWGNVLANIMVTLVGANMITTFTKIDGKPITTTMMTANLCRMVVSFTKGITEKDKEETKYGALYLSAILLFIVGAALSYGLIIVFYRYVFMNHAYLHSVIVNSVLFIPLLLLTLSMILYSRFYLPNELKK